MHLRAMHLRALVLAAALCSGASADHPAGGLRAAEAAPRAHRRLLDIAPVGGGGLRADLGGEGPVGAVGGGGLLAAGAGDDPREEQGAAVPTAGRRIDGGAGALADDGTAAPGQEGVPRGGVDPRKADLDGARAARGGAAVGLSGIDGGRHRRGAEARADGDSGRGAGNGTLGRQPLAPVLKGVRKKKPQRRLQPGKTKAPSPPKITCTAKGEAEACGSPASSAKDECCAGSLCVGGSSTKCEVATASPTTSPTEVSTFYLSSFAPLRD